MVLDPWVKTPTLSEHDLVVLERLERSLDGAIRGNVPGTKLVYIWRDRSELSMPQIRHLERRYVDAGWSKLSVASIADSAHVITLIP